MPNRTPRRGNRERQELAAEAARIMATEGQRSYLLAKHKAAERLGASTGHGLPSNKEVEAALREWQQLYGGEDFDSRLRELREAALRAMRFLKPFRPKLVGPVLEGTADEFSRICLHLFADDPDAVVRFLMENGIPFEQERRRVRWHDGSRRHIDVLVVHADGELVELAVMVGREAWQALPSPIDGKPQRRGSLAEVKALLA
ncbi:MAG: hypothetical protein EA370_12205 [Wenzhouxiangella sp.]|nr:MAG: hypothetical protein EA370_12205 [Wenzhouxiangella sp.]